MDDDPLISPANVREANRLLDALARIDREIAECKAIDPVKDHHVHLGGQSAKKTDVKLWVRVEAKEWNRLRTLLLTQLSTRRVFIRQTLISMGVELEEEQAGG